MEASSRLRCRLFWLSLVIVSGGVPSPSRAQTTPTLTAPVYLPSVEASFIASDDPDWARIQLFTHASSASITISDREGSTVQFDGPVPDGNLISVDVSNLAYGTLSAEVSVETFGPEGTAGGPASTSAIGEKRASNSTLPIVLGIELASGSSPSDSTLTFLVEFDEGVRNVSQGDFEVRILTGEGAGIVTETRSLNPWLYEVIVSVYGIDTGPTTLALELVEESNITDGFGNGDGNGGYVEGGISEPVVSTFDRLPDLITFVVRAEDVSNETPFQLTPASLGTLIPNLAQRFPGGTPLTLRVTTTPVPNYPGAIRCWFGLGDCDPWDTEFLSELLVGPEMIAVALKISGLVRVNHKSGTSAGEPLGTPLVIAYLRATTVTATSNVGNINTFLFRFRLNLASAAIASRYNILRMHAFYPRTPSIEINAIAEDDAVNILEAQSDLLVSGRSYYAGNGYPIRVELGGRQFPTYTNFDDGGAWSVTVPSDHISGLSGSASVHVSFDIDREVDTYTREILVDLSPPSTFDLNLRYSAITASAEESIELFEIVSDEIGTSYRYSLESSEGGSVTGSGVIAEATQRVTVDHSDLADGSLTLTVTLTDVAGNVGDPQTKSLEKDTVPPVLTLNDISGDNIIDASEVDDDLVISGTTDLDDGSSIFVQLNGSRQTAVAQDGVWSTVYPDPGILRPASWASATTLDPAGNTVSVLKEFIYDPDPPSGYGVDWLTTPIDVTNQGAATFDIFNGEEGSSYEYEITSSGGTETLTGSGSWIPPGLAVPVDVSSLPDGVLIVSVTLTDAAGNTGAPVSATVSKSTNTNPVAKNDAFTTPEDTPVEGNVLSDNGNGPDSDPDGDTLTIQTTPVQAPGGTVVLAADGSFTYTPRANFRGTDFFSYRVLDGRGGAAVATADITITSVNDAPVITLPEPQEVLEDGTLTLGDDLAISVTDPDISDDPLLVRIKTDGTMTLAQETGLSFGDPEEGVALVFEGLIGDVNLALDGLTYRPSADRTSGAFLTIEVDDQGAKGAGGPQAASATLNITLIPVNDAPTFTAGSDQTVDEDAGPQTIHAWASSISAGPADEADQTLSFTVTTDNTPLFSAQPAISRNGSLTYTPAPDANGSALVTVTLSDNGGTAQSGVDTSAPATFRITLSPVNDAPVVSVPAGLATDEDTPLAITGLSVGDVDAGGADLELILTASSTVTLAEGSGLAVTAGADGSDTITARGPAHAVNAALNGLLYTPAPGVFGTGSITVTVNDLGNQGSGGPQSTTVVVPIIINPVNDTPMPMDDLAAVIAGEAVTIGVLANDQDSDGDPLTVASISEVVGGSAATNGTTVIYTADADFDGTGSFAYTVSDGAGGTASARVTVMVNGPGTDGDNVSDNVEAGAPNGGDGNEDGIPDNQQANVTSLPIGTGSRAGEYMTLVTTGSPGLRRVRSTEIPAPESAPADASFPIGQLAFDIAGMETGLSTVIEIILPRGVTVVSYYKYGPTQDNPVDHWYEFLYDGTTGAILMPETAERAPRILLHLTDGLRGDGDLTANGVIVDPGVPVLKTNRVPVILDDVATVTEDTAGTVYPLANDSDPDGDPLHLVSVTQPAHGTAVIASGGAVTYTPAPDYFGTDTFTYVATDGTIPVMGTVTLQVNGIQDPPVAVDDAATVEEDDRVVVDVLANDYDPDGDRLVLAALEDPSSGVAVYRPDRTIEYIPNPDFSGTDYFYYAVSDGNGGTARARVTVTVTGTNDVPLARPDAFTIPEDTALALDVLANDTDPDADSLRISGFVAPNRGAVAITADGRLHYSPPKDFHGRVVFTYTVDDGRGGSASADVVVTVSPVNDAPAFSGSALAWPSDTFILAAEPFTATWTPAEDVDGDALSHTLQLSTTAGFGEILYEAALGDGPITVEADLLRPVLEAAGLAVGTDLTVYLRVRAADPDGAEAASEAQSLTVVRGTSVSSEALGEIPREHYLAANYPNPFNPQTTLVFGLKEPADVQIELFDLTGRRVQTLVSEHLAPGNHTRSVGLGELPTGLYLYRMRAGDRVFTRTLHLVK